MVVVVVGVLVFSFFSVVWSFFLYKEGGEQRFEHVLVL